MEHPHRGEKKQLTARLSCTSSELIQYESNEVYYESNVGFLKQPSVQEEAPWSAGYKSLCSTFWKMLDCEGTSIRAAQLAPMEIYFFVPTEKKKKHPSLKIIICPMAFAEL